MDDQPCSKLLSLMVCGKNDGYQGNFLYRLTSSLNFAAHQLAQIGRLDDVEFLVGDWASEVPLSQTIPLSPEARKICKFVYVPGDVAKKIRPDGGFFGAAALNAALRRACGQYRALYDADSLFPAYSFRALFDLLEGRSSIPFDISKTFFYLNRRHIPWEMVQAQPSVEEWEKYLQLHAGALPADFPNSGGGGSGAGHLAHHSVWDVLRGYNEILKGAGWGDVELTLRATQKYPLFDVGGLGIHLFHMEHWPRNRRGQYTNSILNPFIVTPFIFANDDSWGLSQFNLEMQSSSEQPAIPNFTRTEPEFPQNEAFAGIFQGEEIQSCVKEYLEIVEGIKGIDAQAKVHDPIDTELLLLLAWHALAYMPRIFYCYGVLSAHPIGMVVQACLDIDIYTAYDWKESETSIWSPIARIASILRRIGFRGYAQHLSGNPSTGLSRLKNLSPQSLSIHTALVNDFISPEDSVREMNELLPLMANKSMLILASESPERLQKIINDTAAVTESLRKILLSDGKKIVFLKN